MPPVPVEPPVLDDRILELAAILVALLDYLAARPMMTIALAILFLPCFRWIYNILVDMLTVILFPVALLAVLAFEAIGLLSSYYHELMRPRPSLLHGSDATNYQSTGDGRNVPELAHPRLEEATGYCVTD